MSSTRLASLGPGIPLLPFLFVDFLRLRRGRPADALVRQSKAVWLFRPVRQIRLLFGTLLILNNRRQWVGDRFRSGPVPNATLAIALLFLAYLGAGEIWFALRAQ